MSLANSLREAKGGACSPFLRSYEITVFDQKEGALADFQHKASSSHSFGMTNDAVISTKREKSLAPGIIEFIRIIEKLHQMTDGEKSP